MDVKRSAYSLASMKTYANHTHAVRTCAENIKAKKIAFLEEKAQELQPFAWTVNPEQ